MKTATQVLVGLALGCAAGAAVVSVIMVVAALVTK